MSARVSKVGGTVRPRALVAKQATKLSEKTERIDGGQMVASGYADDLGAIDVHEAVWHHDQAGICAARLCFNDGFEFGDVVNRGGDGLYCKGRGSSLEGVQIVFEVRGRRRVEQDGNSSDLRRSFRLEA
jgi:hypothetical protein